MTSANHTAPNWIMAVILSIIAGIALIATPAAAARHRHSASVVHGAWTDPAGACTAHIVSFDPATGALTCTGTSTWIGTWAGSTTWTLTGRQDPASGAITGRIDEVFKGRASGGRRGTLTFVEHLTLDAAGNTDISGHVVRSAGELTGSRGHARWIGHSNADGSGSGTYSGRWQRVKPHRQQHA